MNALAEARQTNPKAFWFVVVSVALGLVSGIYLIATPDSATTSYVSVVAGESFCTTTGVDDVYTGDGHVEFFMTLRNSGTKSASVDLIPVRHYDDGTTNMSGVDMVTVDVPAGQTWKGHTEAFTYKAHSHEVVGCGLFVGSDTDNEITIRNIHV